MSDRTRCFRKLFMLSAIRRDFVYWSFAAMLLLSADLLQAQTYLNATGAPTFLTSAKVEHGFVNLANGNLHLEIPLESYPQRGQVRMTAKMVYDSRIWQVVNTGSSSWQPTNVANSQGGWRFVTTVDSGAVSETLNSSTCNPGQLIQTWQAFIWTDPAGTQRSFPITTTQNQCTGVNTSTGDAYAADSSGFHMYVTAFTSATVVKKDGTQVYPSVKDTNGNFFTVDVNGNVIDTLNRTLVTKSVVGPTTFYDVLNSQGATSRFSSTTTTVNVNTAFGQSGVAEYSGSFGAVQSISLPDGTSYSFGYDSGTTPGFYGQLSSMTLRTGGLVQYQHTNFSDSNGNINRWLTSRTSSGTWSYTPLVLTTCAVGTVGCQQQVTVARPSGDQTVFTFTLNNGDWNTQTQFYNGAVGGGTLLRTITKDYDFSNACVFAGCFGNAYIQVIRDTTIEPVPGGNISKKTEYSYDSIFYGNFAAIKDWYFYASTPPAVPDREKDIVYQTGASYVSKDIHDRATSTTIINSAGTRLSQTLVAYDGSALGSITGITHHDDVNFGTGNTVRGNPTQVQRWVSGTTFLTTTTTYDMTGQLLRVTNPRGHSRIYTYANNFYKDANPPVNPPASFTPAVATNAYVTQIMLNEVTGAGSLHFGYYFNTGKVARDQDMNLSDIFHHYVDPLDRETHTYDRKLINTTRGWTLRAYTSATQTDTYRGITDTTASVSCVSCRHDQDSVDGFGRGINTTLASDPSGATKVDAAFDANDRLQIESNPYRSTSDPTYGVETASFDGLDRATLQTHADSNALHRYFGAAVSGGGGAASQLCAVGTFGLGFPILSVDEAGKKLQKWVNVFGRTIEIDEPDSTNALTVATCYAFDALQNNIQIVEGTQTRTYTYDGISRRTSAIEPETGAINYFYTASDGSICSGADDLCRKTDGRGVTVTNTYDIGTERDRLTGISYSDGTHATTYSYDQASFNGLSITFGGNRRTGMIDASGQTAWSYDPFGHIVIERRTIGTTTENTTYVYNIDGSAASVTYPSGRVITYTYNNAQQVVSVIDTTSSTKYITGAVYTPHGKLSSAVHGLVSGGFAGITESYTYNNRLQTTTHTASSTAGTVVNDAYSHDLGGGMNNGSIAVITNNLDVGRTQTFTYDNLNRLSTAQSQATSGVNCWGNSYGYDRFGNLLAMNVTQCTAPNLNVTVNNNNQIIGMTYDAAGNLTNDGSLTYSWDGENRLKSAAGVNYTWDGTNMRAKKGTSDLYWFAPASCQHQLFGRSTTAGVYNDEFVYFNGQQVGYRDNTAGQVYHYLNDNRGSAKVMASSTGVTKFESDYYPQGAARIITSTKDSLLKFQGKQQDTESGLLSVPHMYNPNLARVLSPVASQVKNRSTLLPQALNKMNATAGRPMATFAAFFPENCQQCQNDCTSEWAVCIGRNFPIFWPACQAALGTCYAKCEVLFGPDCSILPPAPKKPRKPRKPSPGTPATPGAPAPWWPPVPVVFNPPTPSTAPPDDNGDHGPGSGWCPSCPTPELIPRGPGSDEGGGDDGGGSDNPGPFTDAPPTDSMEP
jgi:YD repeat-containing protein